jgi:hypothetical protein
MIQKFNQFITESNNTSNALSAHEEINEPFASFFERAYERLNMFKEVIEDVLSEMDKVMEELVTGEFDYAIVGEPTIEVEEDLSEVVITYNTNIPNNDEAWEADDSPALNLESYLSRWFRDTKYVGVEIGYKPDENGNCIIELKVAGIDSDNFGDFADALEKLGEDW